MPIIDWVAIREAYEAGASKQALSTKHGISRQAIIKRARKENWIARLVTAPQDLVTGGVTNDDEDKESDSAILSQVRHLIAQRLEEEPENKDIKMLMDSFSQVKKLELLTASSDPELSQYDMRELLSYASEEQRAILKPIFADLTAKKAEAEAKVQPMRKTG